MKYVVGLGANLEKREKTLKQAVAALARLPGTTVVAYSSCYETQAVGYTEQPDFLNQVVVLESNLSPHALLGACLGIEAALGRMRSFRNAPRVVDLDLLLAESGTEQSEELILPHPRMAQRAFVMVPLEELKIAGHLEGLAVPERVGDLSKQKIQKKSKKGEKRG